MQIFPKKPCENSLKISDEKLYELCKLYGERARLWRQKFTVLLPEVARRELYLKKGFGSIFEFAAKLAGMSKEQVQLVLNLDRNFADKPILREMLENGEVSINKLARIVSIATPENQLFWAVQAKILPKTSLETLVRDEKNAEQSRKQNKDGATAVDMQNGLFEPRIAPKSLPGHQELLELQNKGIDINALMLKFLEERELKIAQEKEKLSAQAELTNSRYISAATRKILKEEHGEKCSIKTCIRPAKQIHHTQRFSLAKTHDPKYLAPLCAAHHRIAHSIDVKFNENAAYKVP